MLLVESSPINSVITQMVPKCHIQILRLMSVHPLCYFLGYAMCFYTY